MHANSLTIHSINPTGMFSYGLSSDIGLLNKGLVHLIGINEDKSGDSNGAGKSSLFNAACELLFRENPTGCKGDSVINSLWGKGMAGRIYFTNHLGDHYRVTYCRGWKDPLYPVDNDSNTAYLGTSLFLDKFEDGSWLDYRGSGMPETHLKVLDAIGMSYERFLAIVYMSHRVGDQFLRGKNKDRMDILSGITGIGEWDSVLEKSRHKKKALSEQIGAIDKKINFEEGSLQTLQESYESNKAFNWDSYIEEQKSLLDKAKGDWRSLDTRIKEVESKVEIVKIKQQEDSSSNKIKEVSLEIKGKQKELQKLQTSLYSPVSKSDFGQSLQKEQETAFNDLSRNKGMLRAFIGEAGSLLEMTKCPTCESSISKKKKESIKGRVAELESTCSTIESRIKDIKQGIKEDQVKAEEIEKDRRKEVSEEISRINKEIEELNSSINLERDLQNSYYEKINKYQSEISKLNLEKGNITLVGKEHKNNIESAKKSIENIKALAGQIAEKKESVKFYKDEISQIQSSLDVYLWLIDNIPYIKLHKMSVSMAEMSDLINEYLEDLGDSLRVSITSFEEKARKKNAADVKALMKSDVKIEIVDGAKNISPKLYSDGEASKISIAVIRALNELARKYGQGCNLMFMDEVFSFVDSNNSQKIALSMSKLLKKGTVFLTDNSGSVKDLINFDHVWTARKSNGQTFLEED